MGILLIRLLSGNNKLLTGNQLLKLVLLKRSLVFFQRPTAELPQLKLKSMLTNNHSENKLKTGSTPRNKNFSLKLLLLKAESLAESIHGRPRLSLTLPRSRNNSTAVSPTRMPRLSATLTVLPPRELLTVLSSNND